MKNKSTVVLGILAIIGAVTIFVMANELKESKKNQQAIANGDIEEVLEDIDIAHNPPAIEDVPEGPEGEAIKRGYALMMDTSNELRKKAQANDGEEVMSQLACTSCHAGAGLDENVSSLVGVTTKYPKYRSRNNKIATIEDRINGCMVRSMNYVEFEEDDEDLSAMAAYLSYISKGVPQGADLPWLGKNEVDEVPIPNVDKGNAIFQQSCVACHATDGAGSGPTTGPALWGDGSFNDGAGMGRMSKMTGFVQKNMPLTDPGSLTIQEAADVSAFILSQERPEFKDSANDWPDGDGPKDIMNKEKQQQVKDGTIDWEKVLSHK
ncbi:c-type cytochrome [Sporosarcina aquimarina]|uniref:C-type cytochrome n=1 Tax=Sporosarcina aquimarina TaxID=114975 RepID=A0ABU4FWG2_9BACL|nr:c-type cytochrome [Sporosarcina aquimarina]MDW0108460.1 c-type cytochrome [Sporosarcina aquimarina]